MIRLQAKGDWQHNAWYFKNMKQCKKFQGVFEDHGAYINWETEEADSFPEMDGDDWAEIYRKPKKRAKDDLDWAFNSYLRDHHDCDKSMEIAVDIIKRTGLGIVEDF